MDTTYTVELTESQYAALLDRAAYWDSVSSTV